MSKYRIAVIVGSLRKDSHNRRLAHALTRLGAPEFEFHYPRIDDLPLYNQDDDGHQPAPVLRLKQEVAESQGVLFVTAEYNRSIPGVLKNAIDNASRPYGHSAWANKPAGVIGVSIGTIGTAMAQQHLRNVLVFLNMPTMAQPEAFIQNSDALFNADGSIGEVSRAFLQAWMDSYVAWVKRHNA
ncbi:MAG TPA: NADPH-dependent FMN reductase [Alicycliphilus sp.]|jgi:chromate reductase|uniref:NADPH-dependent FMN reductase n=1 Tax=Diaphorobacter limosus TaxID=3036128 RepID=A0ABZ0J4B6_9BURK|nr:NADPH-dependent FMN reductase [Diaphorobacter sp. Y-1]MBP6754130.1 NAD(P)H-dependent oxidoreductase [Alicycliphilus sp.]MCA0440135.1 NAD(P)H-dependent oxidoreductase [Pseudomonadota bacterium]MBP7324784.1 NAD(P)H-dependent oxidoreductase [Alicycliphilus sp.]MBP7328359.1 NAD(P)H-dependent oxidoreductase [Alicycliphilus sp.]MBP8138515.1 NAD(P)H-dependent oxidoreductase [Alicycliphilus sp.]